MENAKLAPIPIMRDPNLLTFDKWYKIYSSDLKELYASLREYRRTNGIGIFDRLDYRTFIEFVYYKSNTRVPKWYIEARRRGDTHSYT